ncbi:hypothetical protein [Acetobacter cerevisiae]|uniref:hypothetical protein n=1 Tax=Acetobacter cerevisiae TaxID=178900 RepID=UPI00209EC5DD|nr:hypothetical protein [Acetobacter cerevisiae]MCP1271862.1 hypothetical protein [Acetobacter cerevisiae]MCP1279816.1 hypothetical protein [Acetobacter cerevisiae]
MDCHNGSTAPAELFLQFRNHATMMREDQTRSFGLNHIINQIHRGWIGNLGKTKPFAGRREETRLSRLS